MINSITPNWEKISQEQPEIHELLKWLSEQIYQVKEDSIHLPSPPPEIDLEYAIDAGYIEKNEDKISITDEDIQLDYLVRYAVENLALPSWDNFESFSEAFADIQHRGACLKIRKEIATSVLLILVKEYELDLLSRISEAANQQISNDQKGRTLFWDLYSSFCDVLPLLDPDPKDLAEKLDSVINASRNDLTSGSLFIAIEKLAERSEEWATSLKNAFIEKSDSPTCLFAGNALIALSKFNLNNAHKEALSLLNAEELWPRKAAIQALGRFDYSSDKNSDLLDSTFEHFQKLTSKPNNNIDFVIVQGYRDILSYDEERASAGLVELSKRSDQSVKFQLSLVVIQFKKDFLNKNWFKDIFLSLASVPSDYTGIIQNIDSCIRILLDHDPDLSITFLEAFIGSRDYANEGNDYLLPKLFQGTCQKLRRDHRNLLKKTITHWFASDEQQLHSAARDIIADRAYSSDESSEQLLELDQEYLSELEEDQVIHILKRVMGYVFHSKALTALLTSSLKSEECSERRAKFVSDALSMYVLYNYPGEAGEYLRNRKEELKADPDSIEFRSIKIALDRIEKYLEARKVLPIAKELQPPSRRTHLLNIERQKQYSTIKEQAEKQSVMLNIIHKVPLKYGVAHFMENSDGSITSTSPLGTISSTFEPPRGDLIDPLGQFNKRLQWKYSGIYNFELSEKDEN